MGPWRIQLNTKSILTDDQVQGWFISMWRRQADGGWKVAVDAGVSAPMTFAMPATVTNGTATVPTAARVASDAASAKLAITAAENAFGAAAKNGIGGAIEKVADPQLRLFREGKAAAFGARESHATLEADVRKAACAADQVIASESGDFGYTYGTCTGIEGDGAPKYGFLHVWRKQPGGSWSILVDVTP
jgi:ketosteroid isomerase-like protein